MRGERQNIDMLSLSTTRQGPKCAAILCIGILAGAGCGGGEKSASSETQRTASPALTATTATVGTETQTTATSTTPATTSTTTPPPTSTEGTGGAAAPPESDPGGAGDEEGVRVPAAFSVGAGAASPRAVSVPAFLRIELRVKSSDGKPHTVRVATVAGSALEVPASGTATRSFSGLAKGTYALLVDGRDSGAVLRAGAEPGP